MDDCVFCKIIKGEIPCEKVYEDNYVLAFLDIMPISRGHTLLVPKKHTENFFELDNNTFSKTFIVMKEIAPKIQKAMNADAFNIGINTGKASGQVVMHAHLHIIPRYEGDGLKHWPQHKISNDELKEIKNKILPVLK